MQRRHGCERGFLMVATSHQEHAAVAAKAGPAIYFGAREEAQQRGVELRHVLTERLHRVLAAKNPNEFGANAAWRRMNLDTRAMLVSLATDRRSAMNAASGPWGGFTPDEQVAIGALARLLRRDLAEAGVLR